MIRERERIYRFAALLFDILVTALSYLGAVWLRRRLPALIELPVIGHLKQMGPSELFVGFVPAVLFIWMVLMFLFDTSDFRVPFWTSAKRYLKVVLVGGFGLVGIAFAAQLFFVPRSFTVLFVVVNWVALTVGRSLFKLLGEATGRREVGRHRLLLVGAPEELPRMLELVREDHHWSFQLVGALLDDRDEFAGPPESLRGVKILGNADRLRQVLMDNYVDTAMFALTKPRTFLLDDAIAVCDELGVRGTIAFFPLKHLAARVAMERMSGVPVLSFQKTPTDEAALLLKRLMDVVVSAIALLLLSPLLLLVAVAIKLESKGPVLYMQKRGGIMGAPFNMLKFRTMVADADALREKLLGANETQGAMFKMRNDPRITRVGKFLRRTSIDELPQLINVLLNDMSLVGPRPALVKEVAKLEPWQRRRQSVKPGITCIWQVSGRSNTSFERWMRMDLEYIDKWSLWLDVKLLLLTVPAVIKGDGAY